MDEFPTFWISDSGSIPSDFEIRYTMRDILRHGNHEIIQVDENFVCWDAFNSLVIALKALNIRICKIRISNG